ncbi:putative polygalacturonate 4-alpha-galacturonosyltransferase [Helianthus annuus]|uniref:Polygalacturonate 4-alpha-galacturonosyltransferase n=1 Tax=Helianthus annuus TaxID=4232 RepID=A0A9K3EN97_HELAN|nr:putative polygalacturonate 4-alpha-galacturonosyltransferase [Helianthus annuus]
MMMWDMATTAFKRGNSMTGGRRNSGGSGSWMSIVVIMLLLVLAPVGYFFGSGMYTSIDWRAKLAFQHIRSPFSKRVIDVIKASTDDLGPLSLDSFRKNNLSASWKFTEQDHVINSTSSPAEITEGTRKWTPTGKLEKILDGHSQSVDTLEKLARRVIFQSEVLKGLGLQTNRTNMKKILFMFVC